VTSRKEATALSKDLHARSTKKGEPSPTGENRLPVGVKRKRTIDLTTTPGRRRELLPCCRKEGDRVTIPGKKGCAEGYRGRRLNEERSRPVRAKAALWSLEEKKK